jgi:hypothetical protein
MCQYAVKLQAVRNITGLQFLDTTVNKDEDEALLKILGC